MLTWGCLAVGAFGVGLNLWSKDADEGERPVARAVGLLLAIAGTAAAFFFAVTS